MTETYDRTEVDVGNIVAFEHINLTVPDLGVAGLFYSNALGFTRDPYIDLGPTLLWFNLGRQQFHIPFGTDQVLRGTIEITTPSLSALVARLERIAKHLGGTKFGFESAGDAVMVTGPWGNRFLCREPAKGQLMELGIAAVNLPVAAGIADGIGRFYQQVLGAPAELADGCCTVTVGPEQVLRFTETIEPVRPYDGHHIAVYVADFSGPHRRLVDRGLIEEESNRTQYRFNWIVDPDTGERLFELEHEVRSLYNPLYARPLVNRNPEQRLPNYVPGADPYYPARPTRG